MSRTEFHEEMRGFGVILCIAGIAAAFALNLSLGLAMAGIGAVMLLGAPLFSKPPEGPSGGDESDDEDDGDDDDGDDGDGGDDGDE